MTALLPAEAKHVVDRARELVLNPLLRVRWRSGGTVLHDVEKDRHFGVGPDVERVLPLTVAGGSRAALAERIAAALRWEADRAERLVDELVGVGVLVQRGDDPYAVWRSRNWHSAMFFHLATSNPEVLDRDRAFAPAAKQDVVRVYAKKEPLPELFKQIGGAPFTPFPAAGPEDGATRPPAPLGTVLRRRRTVRRFGNTRLTLAELATVLRDGAQPLRDIRARVAESFARDPAFALVSEYCAFEIYPVVLAVDGVAPGAYHYDLQKDGLALVREGAFGAKMTEIAIGQGVDNASVVVLISAVFERYMWRYRMARAYRNLLMDASALAHRFILTAEALRIRQFMTPAIRDTLADDLLGFDGISESPVYLMAFGRGS